MLRRSFLAFKYNPPTRKHCEICEDLHKLDHTPIISTYDGKASKANDFPIHNWYNFVLGYTPEFPKYMFSKLGVDHNDVILDPFMGSGTTLIYAKSIGVKSIGIDANDFMYKAGTIKLNWDRDVQQIKQEYSLLKKEIESQICDYDFDIAENDNSISLFEEDVFKKKYKDVVKKYRPDMLTERYISDKPFAKAILIRQIIDNLKLVNRDLFQFALTSILVPISNVSYGPGFGIKKPKDDVDVVNLFDLKIQRIISDLDNISDKQKETGHQLFLGDSRVMTKFVKPESISFIITSPPYPGDHEYTKHTRLELIFDGIATDLQEFREIKKRMIRGSTTNIYKDDNDRQKVSKFESIRQVTDEIQKRLDHDGATSGFEKLYTKLVWEYFGGMYKTLEEAYKVLKPGGSIALLVSDSHAFKMVHIQTAKILGELGLDIGYRKSEILLWQFKNSTSHKYDLREDILILTK